jgi:hypothetical protein
VRVVGDVVADRAPQVMAQALEEQRVEAEQPAHRLVAQCPLGTTVDGMAPLLRHAVRTRGHLAPGPVGRGQHDPRDPVRRHHPAAHEWNLARRHERQAS